MIWGFFLSFVKVHLPTALIFMLSKFLEMNEILVLK